MKRFIQYWQQPFRRNVISLPSNRKLIVAALLSTIAAMFQSAGGFMPGIGFFMSAMATIPIFLVTFVSFRNGIFSYATTIILLFFVQPSELLIFPFTTGILGVVLGAASNKMKSRLLVVFLGALALFTGIISVLYLFKFPLLGPTVSTSIYLLPVIFIGIFSFFMHG